MMHIIEMVISAWQYILVAGIEIANNKEMFSPVWVAERDSFDSCKTEVGSAILWSTRRIDRSNDDQYVECA